MRAPYLRRTDVSQSGETDSSFDVPEDGVGAAGHPTTQEMLSSGEFHRRLADAREKREEALRLRNADHPVPQPLMPPATSFSNLLQAKAPNTASDAPVELSDPEPEPKPTLDVVESTPPVFKSTRVEFTADDAARRRLGAAMALSSLPQKPLEPALVPLVSANALIGFADRPAVPGVMAFGVFALLGWLMLSGGEPPASTIEAGPVAAVEIEEEPVEPVTASIQAPMPLQVTEDTVPVKIISPKPERPAEPFFAGTLRDSQLDQAVEYARTRPRVGPEPVSELAVAAPEILEPSRLVEPDQIETDLSVPQTAELAQQPRRPVTRPTPAAAVQPGSPQLASAIDLAVQEALSATPPVQRPAPVTQAQIIPAAAKLGPLQSGARPDRPLVIHVPDGLDGAGADVPVDKINTLITPYVTSKQVPFDVAKTHVRVYHPGDLAAGQDVADRLDVALRDMSAFEPRPAEGLIELWWEGEAAPKRIATDPVPIRITSTTPTVATVAPTSYENSILKEDPAPNEAWVPARRFQTLGASEAVSRIDASQIVTTLPPAAPVQTVTENHSGLRSLFKRLPRKNDGGDTETLRPYNE